MAKIQFLASLAQIFAKLSNECKLEYRFEIKKRKDFFLLRLIKGLASSSGRLFNDRIYKEVFEHRYKDS